MVKNYCGYKTTQVKKSRASKKTGKSRKSHSRRTCYNTDKVHEDNRTNCMMGLSKSCVNQPRPGENAADLEAKRAKNRSKRRERARKTTECGGRDQSECDPAKCTWVSGDVRKYCRKNLQ